MAPARACRRGCGQAGANAVGRRQKEGGLDADRRAGQQRRGSYRRLTAQDRDEQREALFPWASADDTVSEPGALTGGELRALARRRFRDSQTDADAALDDGWAALRALNDLLEVHAGSASRETAGVRVSATASYGHGQLGGGCPPCPPAHREQAAGHRAARAAALATRLARDGEEEAAVPRAHLASSARPHTLARAPSSSAVGDGAPGRGRHRARL